MRGNAIYNAVQHLRHRQQALEVEYVQVRRALQDLQVLQPRVVRGHKPSRPVVRDGGEWLTTAKMAKKLGITPVAVGYRGRVGKLEGKLVAGRGRGGKVRVWRTK